MKTLFSNVWMRLLAFAFVGLASFYIGYFAIEPAPATRYFNYVAFWSMGLTVVLFIFFLFRVIRLEWKSGNRWDRKKLYWLLGVLGASAVFLYRAETPAFRMIMDDHVIAAVSKQMHENRTANVPTRALKINNTLTYSQYYIDKRPVFFHFLGAITSDLTGYRPKNTVYLNMALGLVLIGLLFSLVRSFANLPVALASVVLFLSAPIVSNLASGGGLEICNMVMMLSTLWLGGIYLRRVDGDSFGAFCTSAILLAQTRYESVVFLLPVALIILYSWWKQKSVYLPGYAFVCPVLLIPYLWQHQVFRLVKEMWQMEDVARGDAPFGFEYVSDNLGRAIFYFFSTDASKGNSFLLSLLGVMAIIAFLVFSIKRIREFETLSANMKSFILFLSGFLGLFVILLLYGWEFDQPLVRRLATPLFIPMAVLASIILFESISNKTFHKAAGIFIIAYFFGVTWPMTSRREYLLENNAYQQFKYAEEFLADHEGDRMFIVSDNSPFFTLHNVESMHWQRFNDSKEKVKYYIQQPGSSDMIVFRRQEWNQESGKYVSSDRCRIDDNFVYELLWEKNYNEVYKVQFLKVIDVEGIEPVAPEKPFENTVEYLNFWAANIP